jgi:hypothetical protein
MMEIHIPEKWEIEMMLERLAEKAQKAERIADIETELTDGLSELQCHVYNRASEDGKR